MSLLFYLYIWYLAPSQEFPSRGWPWQKYLHLSLFWHFLSTHSILLLINLMLQCSLTLWSTSQVVFCHPPPSILPSYTLHEFIPHSHHMSKSFHCTMLHPLHHSTLHSFHWCNHSKLLIHAFITFSHAFWHIHYHFNRVLLTFLSLADWSKVPSPFPCFTHNRLLISHPCWVWHGW